MKQGRNLVELAEELTRQEETKRDFVVPTDKMTVVAEARGPIPKVQFAKETFGINNVAHLQLAAKLGIPRNYYDRMLNEAPELLASNLNTWLHKEPRNMMVRTLDGNMRAFLSDRYRPLDNVALCEAALPTLHDVGAKVLSCEVTEYRLYIQAVCPGLSAKDPDPKIKDIVQAGVNISNSEVGLGSLRVEPLIYRLWCLNGAITAHALRKYHVGRKAEAEEEVWEVLSNEAREADDKAFFLKTRDVVKAAFEDVVFFGSVEKMKLALNDEIESADLSKVIEITAKKLALTEKEGQSVLKNLIKDGNLNRFGVGNAITALANDVESYDRAIELERIGGGVFEMPKADWKQIAMANL